ncbi:hypothetical protein HDV57DRAFT_397182 [Trichoderma longibrachiatum]
MNVLRILFLLLCFSPRLSVHVFAYFPSATVANTGPAAGGRNSVSPSTPGLRGCYRSHSAPEHQIGGQIVPVLVWQDRSQGISAYESSGLMILLFKFS